MNGLTAPISVVHARRLLLYSVKHHGTALIAVASLQSVNSSSLHRQPPASHASLISLRFSAYGQADAEGCTGACPAEPKMRALFHPG